MNTKQIGNIGEAKTIAKFVEFGIPVYIPFGDNEKADLIADFNGKLNKIQVKTSIKATNSSMLFSLVSSTVHIKNGTNHIYTNDEIDYFVCYNIERDRLFIVPVSECANTTIVIRFGPTKNNNNKNIHYEKDYLLDTFLKEINQKVVGSSPSIPALKKNNYESRCYSGNVSKRIG